ncbi:response regulator [Rhodopirellula sp. JC639]|uniref:response regulator n=1 Tax=Stieleria mannarensis TaxID=2755585 RepID=UPI0016001E9B
MIVDDVRAYRELLHQWFVDWGFSCSLASGAEEAWQLVQDHSFDLVITDIDMPGVSGLDLIGAIREYGGAGVKRVPVIAISSLQDDEIESITKQVGAIRFSPKPLDRDSLFRDVVAILQPDGSGSPLRSLERGKKETPPQEVLDACPTISPKLRRLLRGDSDHSLRPKD